MQNGVFSPNDLAQVNPQGDYLLVAPGTDLIGLSGVQYVFIQMLPHLYAAAEEFRAETGKAVYLKEGWRSIYTQGVYYNDPTMFAAVPGTSNHGLGLAIDIWSGINTSFTSPEHVAFKRVSAKHGFDDVGRNFSTPEPWHWEWSASRITVDPASGGTTTPVEDDDMPLSDSDIDKVAAAVTQRLVASNAWTVMANQSANAASRTTEIKDSLADNPRATWAYSLANGYSASGNLRSAASQTKIPLT